MDRAEQKQKAEQFRSAHAGPDVFLLPCAWDAASARIYELEGFKAIGTTSAGIAAALGYPDGEKVGFRRCLDVVRGIIDRVNVPVTVDVESGYSETAEGVAGIVREVLLAGAVGVNVEDEDHTRVGGCPLEPISDMVDKIRAIRAMCDAEGVPMFINAKTDAIWLSAGDGPEAILSEAIRRANAYGAAGADGVFIPGDLDHTTISRLVQAIPHPLNIVVKPMTPPVRDLRALGVRRLSSGSGPMRAALGLTRKFAREVLITGTYQSCVDLAVPYAEVQTLFDE